MHPCPFVDMVNLRLEGSHVTSQGDRTGDMSWERGADEVSGEGVPARSTGKAC